MAEWHASVPPSDELLIPLSGEPPIPLTSEPPVTPPPLEDRPKQVIEVDLMINLVEGDGSGDNVEWIDDPRGILDHQDD